MKKILITGSTGFLGKHLVQFYKNLGYDVWESNTRHNKLDKFFNPKLYPKNELDYIIHCAVKTEAGNYCKDHPGEQFLINTEITNVILKFWKYYQPQAKFITFGSSCSYDEHIIKTENNYMLGQCEPGYETYGMVKRYLLQGLKSLNKEFGMQYSCLIPSLIYGPGFPQGDKHFIYDVLNKLIDAKKTQIPPTLWGDGEQKRELIYIDDALEIINRSLTWNLKLVNMSSGQSSSISDYAYLICSIIEYDYDKIIWDTNAFVGSRDKTLVNTYLHDPTLFTPHRIGLKNTINYMTMK